MPSPILTANYQALHPKTGQPVRRGAVEVYSNRSSTPTPAFRDPAFRETATRFPLDDLGRAKIWIQGVVRLVIKDVNGDTLQTIDDVSALDHTLFADQADLEGALTSRAYTLAHLLDGNTNASPLQIANGNDGSWQTLAAGYLPGDLLTGRPLKVLYEGTLIARDPQDTNQVKALLRNSWKIETRVVLAPDGWTDASGNIWRAVTIPTLDETLRHGLDDNGTTLAQRFDASDFDYVANVPPIVAGPSAEQQPAATAVASPRWFPRNMPFRIEMRWGIYDTATNPSYDPTPGADNTGIDRYIETRVPTPTDGTGINFTKSASFHVYLEQLNPFVALPAGALDVLRESIAARDEARAILERLRLEQPDSFLDLVDTPSTFGDVGQVFKIGGTDGDKEAIWGDERFTEEDETKLDGIAEGAEVNRTPQEIADELTALHPGWNMSGGLASVVTGDGILGTGVDAANAVRLNPDYLARPTGADGRPGLMSAAMAAKLAGIEAGAQVNLSGGDIAQAIDGAIGTSWRTGGTIGQHVGTITSIAVGTGLRVNDGTDAIAQGGATLSVDPNYVRDTLAAGTSGTPADADAFPYLDTSNANALSSVTLRALKELIGEFNEYPISYSFLNVFDGDRPVEVAVAGNTTVTHSVIFDAPIATEDDAGLGLAQAASTEIFQFTDIPALDDDGDRTNLGLNFRIPVEIYTAAAGGHGQARVSGEVYEFDPADPSTSTKVSIIGTREIAASANASTKFYYTADETRILVRSGRYYRIRLKCESVGGKSLTFIIRYDDVDTADLASFARWSKRPPVDLSDAALPAAWQQAINVRVANIDSDDLPNRGVTLEKMASYPSQPNKHYVTDANGNPALHDLPRITPTVTALPTITQELIDNGTYPYGSRVFLDRAWNGYEPGIYWAAPSHLTTTLTQTTMTIAQNPLSASQRGAAPDKTTSSYGAIDNTGLFNEVVFGTSNPAFVAVEIDETFAASRQSDDDLTLMLQEGEGTIVTIPLHRGAAVPAASHRRFGNREVIQEPFRVLLDSYLASDVVKVWLSEITPASRTTPIEWRIRPDLVWRELGGQFSTYASVADAVAAGVTDHIGLACLIQKANNTYGTKDEGLEMWATRAGHDAIPPFLGSRGVDNRRNRIAVRLKRGTGGSNDESYYIINDVDGGVLWREGFTPSRSDNLVPLNVLNPLEAPGPAIGLLLFRDNAAQGLPSVELGVRQDLATRNAIEIRTLNETNLARTSALGQQNYVLTRTGVRLGYRPVGGSTTFTYITYTLRVPGKSFYFPDSTAPRSVKYDYDCQVDLYDRSNRVVNLLPDNAYLSEGAGFEPPNNGVPARGNYLVRISGDGDVTINEQVQPVDPNHLLPVSGGSPGDVLTLGRTTSRSASWQPPVKELPSGGADGQVLGRSGGNPAWVAAPGDTADNVSWRLSFPAAPAPLVWSYGNRTAQALLDPRTGRQALPVGMFHETARAKVRVILSVAASGVTGTGRIWVEEFNPAGTDRRFDAGGKAPIPQNVNLGTTAQQTFYLPLQNAGTSSISIRFDATPANGVVWGSSSSSLRVTPLVAGVFIDLVTSVEARTGGLRATLMSGETEDVDLPQPSGGGGLAAPFNGGGNIRLSQSTPSTLYQTGSGVTAAAHTGYYVADIIWSNGVKESKLINVGSGDGAQNLAYAPGATSASSERVTLERAVRQEPLGEGGGFLTSSTYRLWARGTTGTITITNLQKWG